METRIANTEGNTEDLIKRLQPETINQNLQKNGLPPGQVTRMPVVLSDERRHTFSKVSSIVALHSKLYKVTDFSEILTVSQIGGPRSASF